MMTLALLYYSQGQPKRHSAFLQTDDQVKLAFREHPLPILCGHHTARRDKLHIQKGQPSILTLDLPFFTLSNMATLRRRYQAERCRGARTPR